MSDKKKEWDADIDRDMISPVIKKDSYEVSGSPLTYLTDRASSVCRCCMERPAVSLNGLCGPCFTSKA